MEFILITYKASWWQNKIDLRQKIEKEIIGIDYDDVWNFYL
ncbi:MAG: hypothetical protein ACFFB0_08365 [Promethearchaeota archaeon]